MDSNQYVTESKSVAFPFGDIPTLPWASPRVVITILLGIYDVSRGTRKPQLFWSVSHTPAQGVQYSIHSAPSMYGIGADGRSSAHFVRGKVAICVTRFDICRFALYVKLAQMVGFEPTVHSHASLVFKTSSINHSDTSA